MAAVKNSGYFPAQNAVVMLKLMQRQDALEQKAVANGPGKRIRAKKSLLS